MSGQLLAEEAINHLVDASTRYFEKETWTSISIDEPLIRLDFQIPDGVSGWVKFSGLASGWVLFTAPRPMVEDLIKAKVGVVGPGDCRDYMRELSSVVVSNCRRELGASLRVELPDFDESFPPLVPGRAVFVVPMTWKGHAPCMAVCMEEEA